MFLQNATQNKSNAPKRDDVTLPSHLCHTYVTPWQTIEILEMRIKPYVFCVCSIDVDHVVDAWSTPIFKMNVIGFLVLEQHVDNTKPLARATCCQDMLITH